MKRVRAAILKLRRDNVRASEEITRLDLTVVAESATEARIREKAIFNLRFFDENGRDVTERGQPQVQTTIWTLRFENGEWLLHNAVVKESHDA